MVFIGILRRIAACFFVCVVYHWLCDDRRNLGKLVFCLICANIVKIALTFF